MQTYSISQLARAFGLSRSTLLYYDRIGLLRPAARTDAGYRRYTRQEYDRLARICVFRNAGLALGDVQRVLSSDAEPETMVLEERLRKLGEEILHLRSQQHLLTAMLKGMNDSTFTPAVDKKMWVEMLTAAGMDETAMKTWHCEFERRAPDAHYEFLLSLGISASEALHIQQWSRQCQL